jgi:hypothetical protein
LKWRYLILIEPSVFNTVFKKRLMRWQRVAFDRRLFVREMSSNIAFCRVVAFCPFC